MRSGKARKTLADFLHRGYAKRTGKRTGIAGKEKDLEFDYLNYLSPKTGKSKYFLDFSPSADFLVVVMKSPATKAS